MFCAPLFVAGTDIMGGAGDQANDVTLEEIEATIRREHSPRVVTMGTRRSGNKEFITLTK